MYRMRLHSSVLAGDVRRNIYTRVENPTTGQIRFGLSHAWLAWSFAMRNKGLFGANSFALLALASIAETLEDMGVIQLRGGGGQVPVADDWGGE